PTVFNYWLNHAKNVRTEYVVAMKALLKAKKEDVPLSTKRLVKNVIEEVVFEYEVFANSNEKQFLISKQARFAMKFEAELTLPRGRPPSNTKKENQIKCPNLDTFPKRRSSEIAAKKYGFKCKNTYLNAKKVVLQGAPELV